MTQPPRSDSSPPAEGTICAISFVKEVLVSHPPPLRCMAFQSMKNCTWHLRSTSSADTSHKFPYALKALPRVAKAQWWEPSFQEYIKDFPEHAQTNEYTLISHVEDLTQRDVKIASLKNLQGTSQPQPLQRKRRPTKSLRVPLARRLRKRRNFKPPLP